MITPRKLFSGATLESCTASMLLLTNCTGTYQSVNGLHQQIASASGFTNYLSATSFSNSAYRKTSEQTARVVTATDLSPNEFHRRWLKSACSSALCVPKVDTARHELEWQQRLRRPISSSDRLSQVTAGNRIAADRVCDLMGQNEADHLPSPISAGQEPAVDCNCRVFGQYPSAKLTDAGCDFPWCEFQ